MTDQKTPVEDQTIDSTTTGLSPTAPEHARRNTIVIALLLVSTFVVFLNETIMNVALPPIMDDLGVEPSVGQWLTTAFLLTMAVVIPTTGFLLQRFNTRTVYIAAMVAVQHGHPARRARPQLRRARRRSRRAGQRHGDHDAAAHDDRAHARAAARPRADHGPSLDRHVGRARRSARRSPGSSSAPSTGASSSSSCCRSRSARSRSASSACRTSPSRGSCRSTCSRSSSRRSRSAGSSTA